MAPPQNINEALSMLEGKAVVTSKGNFVNMKDVRALFEAYDPAAEAAKAAEEGKLAPKSMDQAKAQAKDDPMFKDFPKPSLGMGRAVLANEPPPAARA